MNCEDYNSWINIDVDLQVCEEYSEDQICQSIINENTISDENEASIEDEVEVVKLPSNKEVQQALETLRNFVQYRGVDI